MSNIVPILILIFNRPDKTKKLLDQLAVIKPSRIYVGADGPRNSSEKVLTDEVRALIDNSINWDCEVKKLYRETNLGLRVSVSQSLNWFFIHEEYGVILEDDCLPQESFLSFSTELLEKYKHDNRIMHISGLNSFPKESYQESYHFSIYPRVWGWATWRRAWQLYNDQYEDYFNLISSGKLSQLFTRKLDRAFWRTIIEKMKYPNNKMRNSWAYLWALSIRMNDGLCITPNVNLIRNIGFDKDATNTIDEGALAERIRKLPVQHLTFPLVHPHVIQASESDDKQFAAYHLVDSFWARLKMYIKIVFPFIKPPK